MKDLHYPREKKKEEKLLPWLKMASIFNSRPSEAPLVFSVFVLYEGLWFLWYLTLAFVSHHQIPKSICVYGTQSPISYNWCERVAGPPATNTASLTHLFHRYNGRSFLRRDVVWEDTPNVSTASERVWGPVGICVPVCACMCTALVCCLWGLGMVFSHRQEHSCEWVCYWISLCMWVGED